MYSHYTVREKWFEREEIGLRGFKEVDLFLKNRVFIDLREPEITEGSASSRGYCVGNGDP